MAIKVNFQQILTYALAHPMELMALIGLGAAIQSKDRKQINAAGKTAIGVIATDINTTDPDVKKALADLSTALSKPTA